MNDLLTQNLLDFINFYVKCLNSRQQVHTIYADFSKGLDNANDNIFLFILFLFRFYNWILSPPTYLIIPVEFPFMFTQLIPALLPLEPLKALS